MNIFLVVNLLFPITLFIIYLFVINKYYTYYNHIVDKIIIILIVIYYSLIDIKYGILACLVILIYYNYNIQNSILGKSVINNIESPVLYKKSNNSIELVISRYNENLNWINTYPFNKYPVICYNKGDHDNFIINNKDHKIINLKNVGKCDHTYLYHIINNYDNLADVTVFLPGSINMNYKIGKAKRTLYELDKNKQSVFICNYFKDVKKDLYNFKLDTHKTAYSENFVENNDISMEKSKVRPFGKWYESKFGDLVIHHVSFWGIMAISKEHIQQHSKQYYIDLIKDVENTVSPEAGHYMERSWEAIFYPMTGTNFIIR